MRWQDAAVVAAAVGGIALAVGHIWSDLYWALDILPNALGPGSQKIHRDGDRQYLWAAGDSSDATSAEWFDLTDAPLRLSHFEYGIGKDSIAAIDRPVFVRPDDPRLIGARFAPRNDVDKLRVIGYAHNGQARAYPLALMNSHELVNDTVGGKPVTVGW